MFRARGLFAFVFWLVLTPLAVVGQSAPAPPHPLSWVPQGFEVLGQRAAFHTDFTFDRSMLQMAGFFVGDADPDLRNAIGKLNGISVHSFHYAAPGLYDPAVLESMRRRFEASGWKHMVATHGGGDPFNPTQTDLWINFAHMDVTGMMVLIAGPKDLNLVALDGDLSTVDLLHLRGHFGIPRFPADRFQTSKGAPARPPYVAPAPAQPTPQQASPDASQDMGTAPYPGSIGIGGGPDSGQVEAAPPPPNPPGL